MAGIKTVYVDLDGVYVDFVRGICEAHGQENPYLKEENLGVFHMAEMMGLSEEEFWKPSNNAAFWMNLKIMPDALMVMDLIEKAYDPKDIVIMTSPSGSPECSAGKHHWIINNLPKYKRQFFIGPPKHKAANPSCLLIDDYDNNIDKFRANGGQTLLVPRLWNSNWEKNTLKYLKASLK